MERKDNGAKQPGFCHRLFNFIMKNLSLYRHRDVSAQTEQEESKPSISDEYKGNEERDVKWLSVNEEGVFPLIPPIMTIPVEHVEDKQEDKKKEGSVRIEIGKQEKDQDMMKWRPSMREGTYERENDDKLEGGELKKVPLGRPPSQERNEGEASAGRPAKPPVAGVVLSDIDKKAGAWIRWKKESFGSLAAS